MRGRGRTSPLDVTAAVAIEPVEPVERKWRVFPPTAGVPGSLYDFVRRYLCAHGGACSCKELHSALLAVPILKARLGRSQGFGALLRNMRHSGDVILNENLVSASARTLRRLS